MKKYKLIKTLTAATPVLLTPLVAASCNSNGNKKTKESSLNPSTPVSNEAKFYVTILANKVQKELATNAVQNAVAKQGENQTTHSLDFTSYINIAINNAIAFAEKDPNKPKDFNKETFKSIIITSTKNTNVWLTADGDNYTMYVYPNWKDNNATAQQSANLSIKYSLSLSSGSYNTSLNSKFLLSGNATVQINSAVLMTNSMTSSSDGNQVFYAGNQTGQDYSIYNAILQSDGSYQTTKLAVSNQSLPITLIKSTSDGNQVFYDSELGNNSWAIVDLKYDSSSKSWSKETVLTIKTKINNLKITSDGNQVFYETSGNIYLSKLQENNTWSAPENVETEATFTNWAITSDGAHVFYSTASGEIFKANKDAEGAFKFSSIYKPTDLTDVSKFMMSSDGNRIFYTAEKSGDQVWVAGIMQTSGSYTFKATELNPPKGGAINSTGTAYMYIGTLPYGKAFSIVAINKDGSLANTSTSTSNINDSINIVNDLQFSPDGNTFYFYSTTSTTVKNGNVYVARSNWFN